MPPRTRDPDRVRELVKRIKPVGDIDDWAKVLVYGTNGSGKTRFAASAPKVLIIDVVERGTRSAANLYPKARRLEVENWNEVGDIYWFLKSGKHPFESVAIDTITGLNTLAMSFVLDEAEERDPSREKRMPDKRTYGRAGELMKGMLTAFRNLPMHVILTAQERSITEEDSGIIIEYTPDLPAGSRGTALGCVGIVGHLQPKQGVVRVNGKRVKKWVDEMFVGPSELYRTKNRAFPHLSDLVRNPTMSQVITAWQASDDEPKETE